MKKIKYLLLGIVSLLGIGFSFSDSNIDFYIDYFTNNGGLTSYNLSTRSSYDFCSLGINSYSYSTNINDYFSWCPSSFFNNGFGVYFNDNGNKLTYYLPGKTLSWGQYGSVLVISNNLADSSIGDISNGAYSRILGNVNCLGTGIFQTGNFCDSNFIELFTNKYYTISSLGNIYDSDYNGVHYYKGPVAPSVGLGYSFGFVDGSGWQYEQVDGHHYYLNTGDKFYFRTITFSGSTIYPIDGPIIFRLNNTTNLSVGDSYKIIALGPTGDYQDFSFIYSIYNCSSSATSIFDCSFLEGGDIAENFDYDFTLPSNYNYPYANLIYFLTSFGPVKFNNSYSLSNNTLILSFRLGNSLNDNTFTLNLVSSATGFDIIGNIEDNSGGGGNQSTGSIAINTGLLNLCLNDLQFGELNSYLCNRLLSNLGNPVHIPGTSGQYISVSIDENGNLRYWITTQEDLAEQMSGFVRVENDDGTRSTVCPSGDCLGTILAKPIIHTGSGEVFEFTTGTVLDMITNLTGWVGRCPFPYTDFRLGKNFKLIQILQDYGFNYDPFIFVNCAVAGFHYGRHSIDRQIFDDTFEHPLLYGDTQKHRSLFVFLDFIVILGLLGLSAFLKRIF